MGGIIRKATGEGTEGLELDKAKDWKPKRTKGEVLRPRAHKGKRARTNLRKNRDR